MRAFFEGITVFLTGATSGIGLVTAKALAKAGAAVCIQGRDGYELRFALAIVAPFRHR